MTGSAKDNKKQPVHAPRPRPGKAALEHQRLVSLVNSMADAVIAVDEEAKVVLFNGAALNVLDINSLKPGDKLARRMKLTDRYDHPIDVQSLITEAKTQHIYTDYRLLYGDKESINLYLSIAPVHLSYGIKGTRGYVLLMRDITRDKSLEEERDEFISVVSHELRTPITIAEGNLSNTMFIAEKKHVPEEVLEAIKHAYDHIMILATMVNDLTTLSRAERGVLPADREEINAYKLVMSLADDYRDQAASKGLELKVHASPELEIFHSTRLYVREILQNFVTNAIKYTDKGHVSIEAHPAKKGIMFEVSDTGMGINKQDQKRIFHKFFRSEDYRIRGTNGTGLGLYVTQKLARLIGAEISLDSKLDEGSTFSVFVPDMPEKPPEKQPN